MSGSTGMARSQAGARAGATAPIEPMNRTFGAIRAPSRPSDAAAEPRRAEWLSRLVVPGLTGVAASRLLTADQAVPASSQNMPVAGTQSKLKTTHTLYPMHAAASGP